MTGTPPSMGALHRLQSSLQITSVARHTMRWSRTTSHRSRVVPRRACMSCFQTRRRDTTYIAWCAAFHAATHPVRA
jgi:hypothetical protein